MITYISALQMWTRTALFYKMVKQWLSGYLRLFMKDAEAGVVQIGRVVTLEHGKGIGGQILHKGVEVAIERFKAQKIYLEAQVYATGYYSREGFKIVSDEFLEDGIPHVKMEKNIVDCD